MADASATVSDISSNCTRCKNPAKTGVRCIKCGTLSHKSCLKMLKDVKFLQDGTMICCSDASDGSSAAVQDKLSDVTDCVVLGEDRIRISYLEEIIRQKELVICNQSIAIKSLTEQVALLKEWNHKGNSNSQVPMTGKRPQVSKANKTELPNKPTTAVVPGPSKPIIDGKMVANAIHNAQAQSVCNDVVNLVSGKSEQPTHSKPRSKSRNILIGCQDNLSKCPFKAAPVLPAIRLFAYHVTNLDPATDVEELRDYLKNVAPDVDVAKLNSKNPTRYSSFKVTVPESQSSVVLDVNIWPSGVILNRFFRPKISFNRAHSQHSAEKFSKVS